MKKTIIKILIILLFVISINFYLTTISNAALSVSTSKSSVSPGETFSVTVSVSSNEAGHVTLSASNATLSKTNIDLMSSSSMTVSCTAGSSGTITINASGTVANYDNETEGSQTAAPKTVSIVAPEPIQPEPQPQQPETPTVQTKSSNANLSNLGINPYDFRGFKAANTSYSVSVPNNVSSISIYATAQHSAARISGTGSKSLKVGKNTFNVVVTAEDGTTKTYTLYITREQETTTTDKPKEPETPAKSSDNLLSSLSLEEGTITPEFDPNIKEYIVNVPEESEEVHITATANNEKATVQIEGGTELQQGENIATIKVIAEDGTEAIYTIKIIKQNLKIALKSLLVSYENENGTLIDLPLFPEFSEDNLEYTIDGIEHTIDSLIINAVPFSEDFSVEVTGNENLQDGRNIITILVKKVLETGEIQEAEYKIIVNRKIAPKIGIVGRIKNSFTGFIGSIKSYINDNRESIIVCALGFSAGAMFILSIYIVIDYRRYKMMLAKIKTLVKENSYGDGNHMKHAKEEENISK